MKRGIDIEEIGKREPYKVPENFFNELEKEILNRTIDRKSETLPSKRLKLNWRRIAGAVSSMAAAIALIIVAGNYKAPSNSNGGKLYGMDEIENAFSQLSVSDQEYLIEIYQEDLFLNQ